MNAECLFLHTSAVTFKIFNYINISILIICFSALSVSELHKDRINILLILNNYGATAVFWMNMICMCLIKYNTCH